MQLLIVNFHYFGFEKYKSGIYPIKPDDFYIQLKVISKDYTFISQAQLVNYINEKYYPEGNYCLITFDDGLQQQMTAFHLLQEWNIPAIFYVPTAPLIEKKVLDVHKLHHIRANTEDKVMLELIKQFGNYEYSEEDKIKAKTQYKYDNEIAREVKLQLNFKLPAELKRVIIDKAFSSICSVEEEFLVNFYMTEENVVEIAKCGMLGSHGHNHEPLSQMVDPESDIHQSINYLETISSFPIQSFSYPYGSKIAVNSETSNYFNGTKVIFGLTMWRGINYVNEFTNPFLLNRMDTNDAPGGKTFISF